MDYLCKHVRFVSCLCCKEKAQAASLCAVLDCRPRDIGVYVMTSDVNNALIWTEHLSANCNENAATGDSSRDNNNNSIISKIANFLPDDSMQYTASFE